MTAVHGGEIKLPEGKPAVGGALGLAVPDFPTAAKVLAEMHDAYQLIPGHGL